MNRTDPAQLLYRNQSLYRLLMMAYMFECKTELDFDWSLHAKTKSVQFTHEQTLV